MNKTHSGFVAIIGPTNAGKSTLLNQIMGRKVSITSHKVQTTRFSVRAVKMVNSPLAGESQSATRDAVGGQGQNAPTQLIFVDTPGVFKPARRLDRAMVSAALDAIGDADAVLLMVDATHGITATTRGIIERLKNKFPSFGGVGEAGGGLTNDTQKTENLESLSNKLVNHPGALNSAATSPKEGNLFAVINKTDAVAKPALLPIAAELAETGVFREIFMTSAKTGDGIEPMLKSLAAVMPAGPYLFDPTDAPDIPDTLYLAELTREKIYKFVHQELPYHIYVETERVDTDPDGVLEIYQKIVVNSENHKKIVVGRGGAQLKQIGTAARHDIQDQWGVNARLHLFVRVEPDWEDRRENYESQGLEFKK
ncbi:MAG: GTPase Era [Rickettsiales bacterium]|jgi:GTP-binding protein Era|nr:GTPase Era [Rickettsiales bacterium]